jgi:alkylation response protein AidB-like acyl-CoA dehydrogenase
MNLYDDPEILEFKSTLDKWIKEDVVPNHEAWEKEGIVPRSVWQQAGELGLLCINQDEKYGGLGLDFRYNGIIYHELMRAGASGPGVGFAVHSDLAASYISSFGNFEQKIKWLPEMAKGNKIGAIAMTEPGTGSDLASISTRAELKNGKWILNGQKTFISNGISADIAIVVARTDVVDGKPHGGLSIFAVEKGTPGYSAGNRFQKLGLKAQDTSELFFENCHIPESNLIGERGKGFLYLMKNLGIERLGIAVMCMGQALGAYETTLKYTSERKAFGRPIAAFQNTRYKLADMKTNLDVGYAFVQKCTAQFNKGTDITMAASEAKLWTSEMSSKLIDECLQLHGGYGFMDEYIISKLYRDNRVQRIYGGTSEIMKEIISKGLL